MWVKGQMSLRDMTDEELELVHELADRASKKYWAKCKQLEMSQQAIERSKKMLAEEVTMRKW